MTLSGTTAGGRPECELARDVLPQAVSANSKTIVALFIARGIPRMAAPALRE